MTSKRIKFTKMQGAGNDYIYLNGFDYPIAEPDKLAIRLSDRHFGVGADGLVLILPSESCDFRMRMFNADGTEAQMCGNASRCIGKYVYEKGLTKKTELSLETLAGEKKLFLTTDENNCVHSVTVNMGSPKFTPAAIPINLTGENVIDFPLKIEDKTLPITCLSIGNPHCVIFLDSLAGLNVEHFGKIIENHPLFPERTNVEFAEVLNKHEIRMRVWERGSGETLACGTGACATAVAAALNHLCGLGTILHLPGGDLEIAWKQNTNEVFLTGPATFSFEGELPC